MTKNLLLGVVAVCGSTFQAVACTGISLTSRDGSYVQARTIEWARGVLQSEYVIIPRGQQLTSFTPTGVNGLTFTAKYGVVGLAVVQKEFIAESKHALHVYKSVQLLQLGSHGLHENPVVELEVE